MARNGREGGKQDLSAEELSREADLRREAVKRTAAALEDRLRERSEQITEVLDRARERVHEVEYAVEKYRYLLIGGALGIGFALGRRRRRLPISLTDDRARYVLVERRPGLPRLLRSLAGGAATLAARQAFDWISRQLDESSDEE